MCTGHGPLSIEPHCQPPIQTTTHSLCPTLIAACSIPQRQRGIQCRLKDRGILPLHAACSLQATQVINGRCISPKQRCQPPHPPSCHVTSKLPLTSSNSSSHNILRVPHSILGRPPPTLPHQIKRASTLSNFSAYDSGMQQQNATNADNAAVCAPSRQYSLSGSVNHKANSHICANRVDKYTESRMPLFAPAPAAPAPLAISSSGNGDIM